MRVSGGGGGEGEAHRSTRRRGGPRVRGTPSPQHGAPVARRQSRSEAAAPARDFPEGVGIHRRKFLNSRNLFTFQQLTRDRGSKSKLGVPNGIRTTLTLDGSVSYRKHCTPKTLELPKKSLEGTNQVHRAQPFLAPYRAKLDSQHAIECRSSDTDDLRDPRSVCFLKRHFLRRLAVRTGVAVKESRRDRLDEYRSGELVFLERGRDVGD